MIKYKCLECGEVTTEEGMSSVMAVYNHSSMEFQKIEPLPACPHCRAVDNFTRACDVPWCEDKTCAGIPSMHGYLMLCGDHYDELMESQED